MFKNVNHQNTEVLSIYFDFDAYKTVNLGIIKYAWELRNSRDSYKELSLKRYKYPEP